MSREFGSYNTGYMHFQINDAAEFCEREGSCDLTKHLGNILRSICPLAYAVCSVEAGDQDNANAIFDVIAGRVTKNAESAIRDLQKYLETYEEVARIAIYRATRPEGTP